MPSENTSQVTEGEAATDQQPHQIDQTDDDIESKSVHQQSLVRKDAVRRSKGATEEEKEGYLNRRSFIANFTYF